MSRLPSTQDNYGRRLLIRSDSLRHACLRLAKEPWYYARSQQPYVLLRANNKTNRRSPTLVCTCLSSSFNPVAVPVRFLTRIRAATDLSAHLVLIALSPSSLANGPNDLALLFMQYWTSSVLGLLGKRWGDDNGVKGIDSRYCSTIPSTDSLLNWITG